MDIIVAILMFGLIVLVHEFGHFFFAKKSGIYVEEFALGMGPKIAGKKIGETLFSIRLLPFGGFCKMLGENEVSDDERSFSVKSVWAKIMVVFGGPLFNFILAFFFAIIYLSISGAVQTSVISKVSENSPAAEAGILPGDKILKINGRSVIAYPEILIYINENKGEAIELEYLRDGEKASMVIKPMLSEDNRTYKIGVETEVQRFSNPFQLIKYSIIEIGFWIKITFYGLGQIFSGAIAAKEISGPVGIVSVVSTGYKESLKEGLLYLVRTMSFFIVLLSANLGVMNLMPIPALDGGRLVFLFIEAIRKKPIDEEKEGTIHFVGYVVLMGLMVLILFNDIKKLF